MSQTRLQQLISRRDEIAKQADALAATPPSKRPTEPAELKAWQRDLEESYGYALPWWDREQLQAQLASPRYLGALYDPASGHLHPLNYTLGLARAAVAAGVRILNLGRNGLTGQYDAFDGSGR